MSCVRAPRAHTATGDHGKGSAHAMTFIHDVYGQSFGLEAASQDNHPAYRFADTVTRERVDTLALANRARALRSRELRRLFIAAVAWTVNAVARWTTRYAQRRHLSDRSAYLLRDIGIRRDQINAMVYGNLTRRTRP